MSMDGGPDHVAAANSVPDLKALKRDLDAKRYELEAREASLSSREAAVAARERVVISKELEASAGFEELRRTALQGIKETRDALAAEASRIQEELESQRLRAVAGLNESLEKERKLRLDVISAEVSDLRQRAESDLATQRALERERLQSDRAQQDAVLAAERRALAEARDEFDRDMLAKREALDARERALKGEQAKVGWREEELNTLRSELERSIEERSRARVSALEHAESSMRDELERALKRIAELERRNDDLLRFNERFGDSPEIIRQRIDGLQDTIARLEAELLSRPSASDKERLVALLEEQRTWDKLKSEHLAEIAALRAAQRRWNIGVQELEEMREQKEFAERRLTALRTEIQVYSEEVARMRSLYEKPEEREARISTIEEPWRTDFRFDKPNKGLEESAWLARISDACKESGLYFPSRLLNSFHTSLKSADLSPLTVLAGVSGTGKSELPRLYSRFGGLGFLSLAVQPNWDSPQSLFGYFNSVENRFNATTLLRALVQAQHTPDGEAYRHGLGNRLLIVLLDEMNLAYVEQYFSEMLSRLEQRRGDSRGASIDIDIGAGQPPYQLDLGNNVLWVGTMNEDETTKSLSDKVIDRSNLLYFPRPRRLHSRPDVALAEEAPLLTKDTWLRWIQPKSTFSSTEIDPYRETLEAINGHLDKAGRALGHRVWQAVERYMANHPDTLAAQGDSTGRQRAMARAFEDQLVLKVMPKLRGIETAGDSRRGCLDPIREVLQQRHPALLEDFDNACRVGYGAFVWNSARYLEGDE